MKKLRIKIILAFTGSCVMITSCNKEYINPSTASVPSVTTSVDGLMNLCAGLQRRFTIGRQSPCIQPRSPVLIVCMHYIL